MKTWSQDLDQKFAQLTSGPNDITGASQLQEVYIIALYIWYAASLSNNDRNRMCFCYITHNFSFKLPGLPTKFQRTNNPYRW